jgi:superfamily II helicase
VLSIIEEYIEYNRKELQDGSDALLTSAYGRIDDATLYRDLTGLTMCEECADDRTKQDAHKCEESIGPHDLRRTAITRFRDLGMSWDTISGRVNATVKMLKDHYDSPTHAQAAERREAEVRRLLEERPPE